MLNVLLESRAPRARRAGSTLASAVAHAALIAGAVALTMPGPADGRGVEKTPPPIQYVDIPERPPLPAPPRRSVDPVLPGPISRTILVPPDFVPPTLPPIDPAGPTLPPDDIVIGRRGDRTASPIGGSPVLGGVPGAAIDERLVDRVPQLVGGAAEPRYPAMLRDAGVQGRVLVQFVVDTLGRAELDDFQVLETPHPQFAESVRASLARYRFTVGEAGGRRVRTRVQMPFVFSLTR